MLGRKKIELPLPPQYSGGFVGFGTGGFYPAQFDNFLLKSGECYYNYKHLHVDLLSSSGMT